MTDWTSTYLAKLPPRLWGDLGGDCVRVALLYCMELRAILTNQPVILLSELDLLYTTNQVLGQTGRAAANGASGLTCVQLAQKGVARDSLWSANQRTYDYDKEIALINTPPPAAAVADRANQKLVTYERVVASSLNDFISRSKAYIDAGFPTLVYAPTRHMICGFRYDDGHIGGFDNRVMTAPATLDVDWSYAYSAGYGEIIAIKQVQFTGVPDAQPHSPNVALVQPAPAPASPSMLLSIVSQPTSIAPGAQFQATFRITNNSSSALSVSGPNPLRIGSQSPQDNLVWGSGRVVPPIDVPANGSEDVTATLTAPATPGSYPFAWALLFEWKAWDLSTLTTGTPIQVAGAAPVQPPPAPTPTPAPTPAPPPGITFEQIISALAGAPYFAAGRNSNGHAGDAPDGFVLGQGSKSFGDNAGAFGWAPEAHGNQSLACGHQAMTRGDAQGQFAYALGGFGPGATQHIGDVPCAGNAQLIFYPLHIGTHDAVPTPLTVSGDPPNWQNVMIVQPDATVVCRGSVAARALDGSYAAWSIDYVASRLGQGSVEGFATVNKLGAKGKGADWTVAVRPNDANFYPAMWIVVTGSAGVDVQWTASVFGTENITAT